MLDRLRQWFSRWFGRSADSSAVAAVPVSSDATDVRFAEIEAERPPDDAFAEIQPADAQIVELPPSSSGEWLFAVPRHRGAISDFCALIEERLGSDADLDALRAFQVAFDELLTNVVSYADGGGGEPIGVLMRQGGGALVSEIRYRAAAYDPTAREAPDTDLGIAERDIGGLGVHLVKEMMDRFEHSYVDGYNVLLLSKTIVVTSAGESSP
jgi:serine/threonine-protein kinase RsbW